MHRWLISTALVAVAATSHAAVEVHTATDFPGAIKKVAVAPLPCHESVNCKKVEKALAKSVTRYLHGVTEVTSEQINEELFNRSIAEPTKEAVVAVAKEIGCDAILLPSVVGSDAKDHWNAWTDHDSGDVHMSDAKSVASTVQILIITAEEKLLMKGQASGESYLQTDPTYFAESQFDKILRKATK